MDDAPRSTNAQPPATPHPPPAAAPPPPAGPNWALLAMGVAVGALVVSSVSWYQSATALDEIGALQHNLASNNAPIIDLAGAPVLGPDTAVVTLVEFSDYECPFCIRHFQQTMPQIVAAYIKTGKIRYAFRDWPVDQLHPQSIRAHEAAHCALEQNRFWELHPRLFGAPGSHAPEQLVALAREVGLDMTAFGACIDAKRSEPGIRDTSRTAVDLGATGTPAFFIGMRDRNTNKVSVTQGLSGAQPFDVFARALDDALAKAK